MEELTQYTSIEKKLIQKAEKSLIPINATFELTPKCNFNCNMCYVHSSNTNASDIKLLSLDEWIDIAKKLKDAGCLFILLTGGEPLLYPDFKELYLTLQDMGMVITINSNGSLFDEETISLLSKHRPRRINITLYGATSDTYDKLCHNKDAYEKVISNIKKLKAAGIDVKVNGSITTENVDEIEKIISFCQSEGVYSKLDTYLYPSKICKDECFNNSRLDPITAARARIKIEKESNDPEHFKAMLMTTYLRVQNPITDGNTHSACRAGKSSLAIHFDGTISPCSVLSAPSFSLKEYDLEKAWQMLTTEVNNISLSPECGKCQYRDICQKCMASAMCETGSFSGKPDYLCHYTFETYEIVKELLDDKNR